MRHILSSRSCRNIITLIALVGMAGAVQACSAAQQEAFKSRAAALADTAKKVLAAAPAYCKERPAIVLDDMALAAIALATSEFAADVIKAGVDKLCQWSGVPSAPPTVITK